MAEYIEREAALKDICAEEERAKQFRCPMGADRASFIAGMLTAFGLARSIIGRQKTAEGAPVRHGQWVGESTGDAENGDGEMVPVVDVWYCSKCDYCIDEGIDDETVLPNFCPNCGAKMDGGEKK